MLLLKQLPTWGVERAPNYKYESSRRELSFSLRQPRRGGKANQGREARVSAAHQAFDGGNQNAEEGVAQKAVVDPVPRESDHQSKIAHRGAPGFTTTGRATRRLRTAQYATESTSGTNSPRAASPLGDPGKF